jgi:DNA-binding GntR family transcriptional regulator
VLPNRDPAGPVLRAPKTAELIAAYIRGQIVRGDLQTGDALPSETVLMEMFGVSRPTSRRPSDVGELLSEKLPLLETF